MRKNKLQNVKPRFFRFIQRDPVKIFFLGLFALTMLSFTKSTQAQEMQCDPKNVVGSDTCIKCHTSEMTSWQQTPHFTSLETLHRMPEAKAIAKKLGIRSVKRNDMCTNCHYTRKEINGRNRVIAGVSCESCHGAAREWLTVHNDYGGPLATKDSESLEHQKKRLQASLTGGMNNPTNLYLVARQCYNCHTVPNEKLVNVGGHTAGTLNFELVAWSQGMIRHNFLRSDGKVNEVSSPERLRVMYVVGTMADLEYSLRAVSKATHVATFGTAVAKRAARMKHQLWMIYEKTPDVNIKKALEAVAKVELTLNNSQAIEAAAEAVGAAARQFATEAKGSELAALDRLIPTPAHYKMTSAQK